MRLPKVCEQDTVAYTCNLTTQETESGELIKPKSETPPGMDG